MLTPHQTHPSMLAYPNCCSNTTRSALMQVLTSSIASFSFISHTFWYLSVSAYMQRTALHGRQRSALAQRNRGR